ncbi:MAG: methylaspartate mutase subunit E [Fibrobacteres bacterium]|nr:methylaspartate mutase subunit E [Fibrobacterota bacterium]
MATKFLNEQVFAEEEKAVLQSWPTGAAVDFKAGVALQRAIPDSMRFAAAMNNAKKNGETLIQPRAGVALIDEHIRLLKGLETDGGADLLPTTIDAYTRQNRYAEAQKGIDKSVAAGTSLLNGFPAVNHGVEGCRRVTEAVNKPIQVRHGTPDARLLAEITLAAGFTSYEGGGISYNIPYAKKVSLEKSIRDWQFVDRLCGKYQENGVTINREPFGPLTGTLVPPCISHACGIIEGLLALEQGVKSITLGYGQGGCMVQDIAAVQSLRECADEWFKKEGFTDYDLTIVFHQWMGGFPQDEAQAFAVISLGSTVAAMGGVEKIIVKTPHEAMGIPTREANSQGLRNTKQILRMLRDQSVNLRDDRIEKEKALIKEEVACLMNSVLSAGGGDWAKGTVNAFAAGYLDVPFAPSLFNKGKVMPVRDDEGFIRFFNSGALPLTDSIKAYHNERLAKRGEREKRAITFQMVTDDIYAISKGKLIGRPK